MINQGYLIFLDRKASRPLPFAPPPSPQAVLYSTVSISALPSANVSVAKFSAYGLTAGFTIPTAAQISLMMWRSRRISSSTLTFVSVVANVAARSVTYVIFTALKTTDPASDPTPMASSYTLFRRLWISIGLEPSAVRNSVTILCTVHTTTTPAILQY